MRVIIAGSRSITDFQLIHQAMLEARRVWGFTGRFTVISGGASGVDQLGERWARECGYPLEVCPADWKEHGRAAGPMRNKLMADRAEALVAVWDGRSRGTADMILKAHRRGLRVHVKVPGVTPIRSGPETR